MFSWLMMFFPSTKKEDYKVKKFLFFLFSALMCITLCSCGTKEDKEFNTIEELFNNCEMQAAIDSANQFKELYPESTHIEEIEKIIIDAEKYIANNFEPIEIKYYDDYVGVLDFGAFSGIAAAPTTKEGIYVYLDIKDYMLIHYVDALYEKGFEDDNRPSDLLGGVGIETNDTIYLKNAHYELTLMYHNDNLVIGVY